MADQKTSPGNGSSGPGAGPPSAGTDHEIVLECRGVCHSFGDRRVLCDINLKVIRGEIVALVGPSGFGKSTLLRAIVGTHPPRQGQIIVTSPGQRIGRVVAGPGRDRGIIYQQYTLFPFLTAQENVAVGLMFDQSSIPLRVLRPWTWRRMRAAHLDEAAAMLEKVKLGDAVKLYPHQMSGGMCQRVAIAQALIMKPEILLMDEPFGALDEATREELQYMMLDLYAENCRAKQNGESPQYTILIVTHELTEAIYVGDRVVALSPYWNWREEGHDVFPGATIVYDKVAPVNAPDQDKNCEAFVRQRQEIRRVAFDPEILHQREEFLRFWQELQTGSTSGVLEQAVLPPRNEAGQGKVPAS
jgi:NitT/TauT family transport system ATP-binding protein